MWYAFCDSTKTACVFLVLGIFCGEGVGDFVFRGYEEKSVNKILL